VEVVKVVAHWIFPIFYGNLASKVANFNLASWPAHDVTSGSSIGDASSFPDFKHRFKVLLEFTDSLASYVKYKNAGHIRIHLPNVKALGASLIPVPIWWNDLRFSVGDAFNYLWCGWLNDNSVDGEFDGALELDHDMPNM
ncbi:hypothetical protein KI387_014543, partial [Taxus chinensis]